MIIQQFEGSLFRNCREDICSYSTKLTNTDDSILSVGVSTFSHDSRRDIVQGIPGLVFLCVYFVSLKILCIINILLLFNCLFRLAGNLWDATMSHRCHTYYKMASVYFSFVIWHCALNNNTSSYSVVHPVSWKFVEYHNLVTRVT